MSGRPKRKVGRLKHGDRVQLDDGKGTAIVTHAAPEKGATTYPHRASAQRELVAAWYVIWRRPGEAREVGELLDPEDEVYLA